MDTAGPEEIRKHVKIYLTVFATLAILTVVTVLVSYLPVSTPVAIAIALIVASVKASLVGSYFMHLISERQAIYGILILSVACLILMLLIPVLTDIDMLISSDVS